MSEKEFEHKVGDILIFKGSLMVPDGEYRITKAGNFMNGVCVNIGEENKGEPTETIELKKITLD